MTSKAKRGGKSPAVGSKFIVHPDVDAIAQERVAEWAASQGVNADDRYLSPADHVATVLADKEAAVAAAEAERDAAKLQAFRMQTQLQIQQAEDALKEKRTHAQAMAVTRRDLAAQIAERYAISWVTHVLEPLTGQLLEAPKD